MYDWRDIEASRRHRDDLLREAERARVADALGRKGGRRSSLVSDIRWELARGLGFVGKTLQHLPTRG
jgi:hypothetical protein